MAESGLLLVNRYWLLVMEYENIEQIATTPDSNNLSYRGVFYSKLVIPAQAGIQKCPAEKAGCPPQPVPAKAGAGMTAKTPRLLK
jgi:hypothetical protein